jgi:outer membrane lipoprotein LolB
VTRIFCLALLGALLLTACGRVPVRPAAEDGALAYEQRATLVGAWPEWGLSGKISLDDGAEGGSGRLNWSVRPGISELDFRAALGRGAWRLSIRPELAILTEANGDRQIAPDADFLVRERLGWSVPVDALAWWVRGLAAPGVVEARELDEAGLLVSLQQFGWTVEFDRYDSQALTAMPRKLNAKSQDYRVKLAISQWRIGESHAQAD